MAELASALAGVPVPVPGKDQPVRYGDIPGVDEAHLRFWAKTWSQVDPDVGLYKAEGRMGEFVERVDMDTWLRQVSCPVLLLQGNPSRGGLVSDADAQHALSLLADGQHVRLENAGHNLGLSAWEVGPLLRAVTNFLESL